MQQTITAFFDNRSEAADAVEKLVEAGIPRTSVQVMGGESSSTGSGTRSTSYDPDRDEGGFWSALGNLFMPDEDRYTYAEGMSRGGTTVVATVDDAYADTAMDILEEHGSVDLDEREKSWRDEGWAGYTTARTTGMAGTSDSGTTGYSSSSTATSGYTSASDVGASGYAARDRTTDYTASGATNVGDEGVIPLMEENLRVGKRQVGGGRVRVRSYTVETPVEEQVSLRQERVHVERRPVDRAVTAADEGMFRDRTIDVEERSEEAVVSKEARVREELVVGKDVENRTQTVSDTVRRTEVDIDDDRTAADRTTTTDVRVDRDRDRF